MFGAIAAFYVLGARTEQVHNEVNSVTSTTAEVIRTHFKHARADLVLMSNSRQLIRYLQSGDDRYVLQQPALIRQIAEYQKASPEYFEISLILDDGFEDIRLVNIDLANRSVDESNSLLFSQVKLMGKDEVLTKVMRHPDRGTMTTYFARAMYTADPFEPFDQNGQVAKGYFVIALDMAFLHELLDDVRIGKSGYLFVVDEQQNTLFAPSFAGSMPDTESLRQAALLYQDSEQSYFGTQFLIHSTPIENGLRIVAVLPQSEFNETVNQLTLYVLLVIVLVIIAIVLLMYQHIRKLFLEPIYHLRQTVNQIGEGNLQSDIPHLVSKDEFGELYDSIQKMRENLNSSQEQVKQLAYFDELTGLPNRITLKHELKAAINRASRNQSLFAVVFIDLDNFKDVNDTLGHDMGDLLLKRVSERIQKNIRTDDYMVRSDEDHLLPRGDGHLIARLGGDEFTLLLNDVDNVGAVSRIVRRLMTSLSQPVMLGEHTMSSGASMGIAIYPQDGDSAEELLKNADLAMYEAKKAGKNHFEFFSREMNALALQRLALESNLRKALDHNEFRLFYQPRVRSSNTEMDGFEALIRWESPQMGFVAPNEFIPFAEESMLICEIGFWVLNTACQQIARWVGAGYRDLIVSINLSPVQIFKGDTYHMIETALRVNGVDGKNLEVEITESGLLKDEKAAIEFLHKVRGLGVRVALDDFGTGYSSLSYLRKLPIDVLKIDRSFIVDMVSKHSSSILESIIELAAKCYPWKRWLKGSRQSSSLSYCEALRVTIFKATISPGHYRLIRPVNTC